MGKVNILKHNLPAKSTKVTTTGKINKAKQKIKKQQKINVSLTNKKRGNRLELDENIANLEKEISTSNAKNSLSFKSVKSQKSGKKTLKKKEKLNLRRALLMKKIDTMKQLKKEEKVREKRKNTSVIGDTNPLRDALPSLESLLKTKKEVNYNESQQIKKKRGIEKARQRKKKLINDIDLFKRAINDKIFKKNPFEIISNHIQAVVERELHQVS